MDTEIRVLHVDDDPALGDVTAEFLERERESFDVLTARSAEAGREILADVEVDCLVSDYDMPGKNGIELLEAVREDYPDLPFILYTGKGSEEVASDAISAGVTDYLQKGAGSSQYTVLANRIENAVEKYRSDRAVAETERKLSEIANEAEDLLFMFDDEWSELLFINEAYEELWGRSIAELETNPDSFLDVIHPDDRERAVECMRAVSAGEPTVIEYRVRPQDDDVRWVRSEAKPIFDDVDEVVRIVGFVSDVTERKQIEATVEQQFERLDRVAATVSGQLRPSVDTALEDLREIAEGADDGQLDTLADSLYSIQMTLDDLESLLQKDGSWDGPVP